MKSILLTGASGFLGRHLLPLLIERGYKVYALSRHPKPVQASIPISCDLLVDSFSFLSDIQADILIHLAWETTPGKFWDHHSNMQWLYRSLLLFQTFVSHGGKWIIGAGTCAEYPWGSKEPLKLYGAAKKSLYDCANSWLYTKQIPFTWGRIFYPYGPYENPSRFIPSIIHALHKQNRFLCKVERLTRDFIHIQDVALAFCTLLENNIYGAVDIGTGEGHTFGYVAQQIAHHMKSPSLLDFASLSGTDAIICSNQILTKKTGWRPLITLEKGLQSTIEWWKHAHS